MHYHSTGELLLLFASLLKIVAALTVTEDTTLTGDQTFSEAVTIEDGATLTLKEGSVYKFENDLSVHGGLVLDNRNVDGTVSFNRESSLNVTGSFELAVSNDVDMFFTSFYNSGSIYVKGSAVVQPAVTFEGLEVFINDGTIDAGSLDEGPAHSAIAFGDAFDPKKTPFINNGKVVVSGTEKFIEGNVVYLLAGNAVSFYAPVEGTGSVEVTNSYIGLNAETKCRRP
ncbi:mannoprotein KNAG_0L00100 [Huiozyma naganishii CBS 8797]|uniref:Hyphally-regulated cell wall protein N-terminal domain-containing protein n=1 Tax=Huiozyma naganishii (strain ATCC MYA-139 / BCRC 22969 / CBS 8797 / KCTC 17520 / NBRC 10181 / NCYC 3082 / Yp74L-3) TaxID=1071383 RepID=J7RRX5_HUIN7|nr:hypothetical protein KNAG_0L00100 [Kazachstania naganishii CBS 8797]CCK72633.1 hypothetical protein KNAG_0L00100 [Kazachstania naganishii CBS 8797]